MLVEEYEVKEVINLITEHDLVVFISRIGGVLLQLLLSGPHKRKALVLLPVLEHVILPPHHPVVELLGVLLAYLHSAVTEDHAEHVVHAFLLLLAVQLVLQVEFCQPRKFFTFHLAELFAQVVYLLVQLLLLAVLRLVLLSVSP